MNSRKTWWACACALAGFAVFPACIFAPAGPTRLRAAQAPAYRDPGSLVAPLPVGGATTPVAIIVGPATAVAVDPTMPGSPVP